MADDDAAQWRDVIEGGATAAYLLGRHYPPPATGRDAVSYFGATPRLPGGIEWPVAADGRPLPFLAQIDLGSWPTPPLFKLLRSAGNVPEADMLRTFNLGVGMTAIVPEQAMPGFAEHLRRRGDEWWEIGRIVPGTGKVAYRGALS